jgi:hypothetical protein
VTVHPSLLFSSSSVSSTWVSLAQLVFLDSYYPIQSPEPDDYIYGVLILLPILLHLHQLPLHLFPLHFCIYALLST